MLQNRHFEKILQWAKRMERRFYLADYEEERLKHRWANSTDALPFDQEIVPFTIDKKNWNSLLIYKPDDIGDAVFSLPALRELRKALKNTRWFLICQEKTAPLYARTGFFEQIASVSIKTTFHRFRKFSLRSALSQFSEPSFDAALYLRTYPAYFRQFLRVPAAVKIHPRDPRLPSDSIYQPKISLWGERRRHQALQMLEMIEPLTNKKYSSKDIQFPKLRWLATDKEVIGSVFGKNPPSKYFVIHPFAPMETRRYPIHYWKEVVRYLERLGVPIVSIGTKADGAISLGDNVIATQGQLKLAETAYLISKSTLFLGNESGPLHLAAALGVACIAFFGGHSMPEEWAPLGRTLVLRSDVPCAPCHQRFCPGYELACLTQLSPEKVFPKMNQFIAKESSLT